MVTKFDERGIIGRSIHYLGTLKMILLGLIAIVLSYLIGSFCSAVFVSHLWHLPDPRLEGSKNPGATNVLRLSGKKYAIIVLLIDMFKGLLPVLLSQFLGLDTNLLGWIALAAVLGHMFPVFYQFEGGKGVATALGAIFGLNPSIGIACCLIWIITAKISRYSSLASILAISTSPALILFSTNPSASFPVLIITCCILYKHKENIIRLQKHEESQIKM